MGLKLGGIKDIFQKGLRRLKKEKIAESEVVEVVKAPKLSDEAFSLMEDLYEKLGPRPSASAATKAAAELIAEKFSNDTEDVTVSTTRIVPHLSYWMKISALVLICSSFLFAVAGLPYVSIVFLILLLLSAYDFLHLKKICFSSFFPTAEATNVHAVIEPEGKVENTVIFTAHHDSAKDVRSGSGILKYLSLHSAVASFFVLFVSEIVQIILELLHGDLLRPGFPGIALSVLITASFLLSLFSLVKIILSEGDCTGGAGDDLSGVAVVMTLASYFSREKKEGRSLKSTRLVFASFDGEECSASGSMAWYDEYLGLLINPVDINFDGLYKEDSLCFLTSDGNGFIPLSSSLASRLSLLASEMGYSSGTVKPGFFTGTTDAASAALHGIRATTLTSMFFSENSPVHSEDDTPDKISPEALSVALSVAIKAVEQIDRKDEEKGERESLFENGRKYRLSRY